MQKKTRRIVLLGVVAALLIGLSAWIAWGNTALLVSEVTVAGNPLPEAFSGFRIAQVSDLHNAEFGEDQQDLVRMLKETDPDCIVLTGDLVDSRRTRIDVAVAFAEQAVQIAPTYYVTGNHEARISGYGALKQGLESAGVTVLEKERVELEREGETIALWGIHDPGFFAGEEESVLAEQLSDLAQAGDGYTILLAHRPEFFSVYVQAGVDLVLSGHAHGGQIRLPFVGGLIAPGQGLFPEYDAGLYTEGDTHMVVSRGIGNSVFPFRVNNRPEIVVVTLVN